MRNIKKYLVVGLTTLLLLQILTGLYLGYTKPEFEPDPEFVDLYEDIYALIESADIPQDLKDGFLSKVEASLQAYLKGNIKATENLLSALMNQLEANSQFLSYNLCSQVEYYIDALLRNDEYYWVIIGVTAPNDANIENAQIITESALEDINQHCENIESSYRFDYVLLSNEANGEIALDNTIWFDENGINLVSGHGWSGQCDSSLEYVNDNDMILFSSSSTYPSLKIDDNLYRLTPDDSAQGNILVQLYDQMGINYVYIYYEPEEGGGYGESIKTVIEEKCPDYGITVIDAKSYDPGDWDLYSDMMDMESQLAELVESEVPFEEIGFQVISTNGIANILSEAEWSDVPIIEQLTWFGTDLSCKNQEVVEDHSYIASKVKVYGTLPSPEYDSPEYEVLASRLENPWFYACTRYDLLWVYAQSVILADSSETDDVKDMMELLVDGYTGASGTSSFDEYGDRLLSDYEIWGYGWIDEEAAFIQYGEYDQETYTLELYEDIIETPPEIELYYPTVWPYTRYYVDDPGNIWYELYTWISIFSKDGIEDIVSMTLTDPNDEVYDMWDDGPWGFEPETTRYMYIIEPEESVPGTYIFTAEDSDGNIAEYEIEIVPWFNTLFDSVSPSPGDWYIPGEPITWSWEWPDGEPKEVDHYLLGLTNDQGFEWWSGDQYDDITYDEETLEEGRYNYELYAMSEYPGGEVVAYGHIYVGDGLVLYEPWFDSFTHVNAETEEETYSMLAEVKVASSGSLEEIDYVKLILPDDSERELVESEEYDGWYEVYFDLDDPISGEFTFEASNMEDTTADLTKYYDGWVTARHYDLSPSMTTVSMPLEFDWSIDFEADDYYQEVTLWDDSYEEVWFYEGDQPAAYDGGPLDAGLYRYEVLTRIYIEENGQGHLYTETWFYLE